MIKINRPDKKEIIIFNDDKEIIKIDLISSSVTNKFEVITEFIEDLSIVFKEDFDNWFCNFITEYEKNLTSRFVILKNSIIKIKEYCDRYIEIKNVNMGAFVNKSKAKKSSIIFEEEEVKNVLKMSAYLKIYSLIYNSELKLDNRLHKTIFSDLVDVTNNRNIIYKIFEVIRTKIYTFNYTDHFMWTYIEMVQGKELDVHIIEIFNFLVHSILVLCKLDKNPITFFVTVIDTSIRWLLRGVYKTTIMYEDDISAADIQTSTFDSLKTYVAKDTIFRLKSSALQSLYSDMEEKYNSKDIDNEITKFQNRISQIESISPVWELVLYPILSKSLDLHYYDLSNLTAEHAAPLSLYCRDIFKKIFKNQFDLIFSMLEYYVVDDPPVNNTYKIKDIQHFTDLCFKEKFMNMKSIPYPYKLISSFIGKILRRDYYKIINGEHVTCFKSCDIESDCIEFFIRYFSGSLDQDLKKIRAKIVTNL